MHNTCMTSTISLRTRGTLSFTFNDYVIERSPCGYFSLGSCCCCCCANSSYKSIIGPSYCYNLYGLRQSSLIQRSPYRKLISGGLDRFYSSRLPVRDIAFSCSCDEVSSFRVGGREGRLRKCSVFEKRSESCDIEDVDEAEILLSLLTEDDSEDCLQVSKVARRLVKKPVVEERENGEVSKKCKSKQKRVDLDVLEKKTRHGRGGLVVSSGKKGNKREEVAWREEEKEALVKEENWMARLKEKHGDALLKKGMRSRKEQSVALLQKASQKDNEHEERKSRFRVEDGKASSRTEEREDLLRRKEHRQNVRIEGSSCSSYYSLSSTGDYESDNDAEVREGRYLGDFSSSEKKNSKSDAMVSKEARKKEELRQEEYREDHGAISTKKTAQNVNMARSSVIEAGLRNKSEKKLADVSVLESELREASSWKESKLSTEHESKYRKSSDYYVSYDDQQENTKFDEERKQQHRQTDNEVLRQSETRMNQKQFVDMQESHDDDIVNSCGSQKIYNGKSEKSSKVASSSLETVRDHRRAVGLSSREDEYQRNSVQVAKVSEIQDTDIRKNSSSQQRFETFVKVEDYSTNIHSTLNDAANHRKYDQVSALVESGGQTQQLTKKEGKSILKKVDNHIQQEKNVNLTYGSSSESKLIKRDDSKKGYDVLTKISVTHGGDSSEIDKEGRNKTKSEIQVGSSSEGPETGTLTWKSNPGISTAAISYGSLQVGYTSLHGHELENAPEFHHETYGEANSSCTQGQPSKLVSPEGTTIGSAALMGKSSAQYVGEFINQVRDEIMSSGNQKDKRTEFVHEEQHHQHNLVQHSSGNSQSKEHDSRSASQKSGTKGPSDEMWNVDELSVQDPSRTEDHQDDASKAGRTIDKRTGRSLWNIISDIALLRWSPRSESHSSGRKTGGKSSPNQSTGSEAWFSGHETAENEDVTEEKEQKSITLGLSGSNQEERIHSRVEEGSSSSTFQGHLKHGGTNVPSSSDAQELGPTGTYLHSGVISEGISTTAMAESSIPLPTFQQQISPAVLGVSSVAEEAKASDIGKREKLNTGLILKSESTVDEGELRRKKFQRQDQLVKDRFDEWEDAYRLEIEQRKIDEKFMWEALLEAQKAADNWEVPVGAVLVHKGKVIARGYNKVEELRDSTAHAEMICIREASNMLRTWRLSETTLYVTLEPCPMCAGAILQARIDVVVWGAPNKLLGADGSWIRLFPDGEGGNGLELSNKPPAPVHPFHPKLIVRRGVLAIECADAMQQFFKLRRKDKKPDPSPMPPTGPHVSHRPFKFLTKLHDGFNPMFCL